MVGVSCRACITAAFVVCVVIGCAQGQPRTEADDRRLFEDFKLTFGRTYGGVEDDTKFLCFRQILRLIDQRNAGNAQHAHHGVNQFSDMCPEEFTKTHFGYGTGLGGGMLNDTKLPRKDPSEVPVLRQAESCAAVDLRQDGFVTPVKNQGNCGSCWSFSSTGNMEGAWAVAGRGLVSLSEEELIACSSGAGNHACNGGYMVYAWTWVYDNGGIDSEQDYPYVSGGGSVPACNSAKLGNKVATIEQYVNLEQNESYMANWVCTRGVVSIAVDATSWQTYKGGIVTNCPYETMDHAVLIVGYNSDWSPPYWIVKNSWGTSWGESGYIRLMMGINACGLANTPCTSIAP